MTPIIALLLLAASPSAAPATAGGGYASVRSGAERVDSLAVFLERYVGSCKDPYTRAECEKNVAALRRGVDGKLLVVRIDGASELVRARSDGDRYRIDVTPFFDGGGLALTHGTPTLDAQGRPIIGLVVLEGALPAGKSDLDFLSPFRTGNVELEVVFKVQGTWKLKRRDGGSYEGVKARFLGIRLVDPRTGAEVASRSL